MRLPRSRLILLLSVLPALAGRVDAQPRLLRKVTIDDGLSQNSVYCLHQDNRGFIWIGTGDGLNRYDGYSITVYRNDPTDSTTLPNNAIRAFAEDHNGMLYVGTDRGVARFDRKYGKFERIWPQPAYKLLFGRSGVLWIGTAGHGLVAFDPTSGRSHRIGEGQKDRDSVYGIAILGLSESPDGTLWLATERGLNSVRPTEDTLSRVAGLQLPSFGRAMVCDMTITRDGRLWLGTLGAGLIWYDPDTGSSGRFFTHPGDPHSLPSDKVFSTVSDQTGNLWVGTETGPALCTDREKGRFRPLGGSYGTTVRVQVDRSGLIWVGTDGFGAEIHTLRPQRFQLLRAKPDDPNGLSGDFIRAVCEESAGTTWIGTFNHGITLWDRRRDTFSHLDSRNSGLVGKDVYAFREDSQGTMWIGTERGLNAFDRLTGRVKFYPTPLHRKEEPSQVARPAQVNGIGLDRNGRVWLATNAGLDIFDIRARRPPGEASGWSAVHEVTEAHITGVLLDGDSLAWAGTRYKGLLRIDRHSRGVRRFHHDPRDTTSLNSQNVRSVFRDSRRRLWVTTDHGLAQLSESTGTFSRFARRDGLPSESLYGVLEDGGGNLWISSNRGVVRFSPERRMFRTYDRQDGLQSNEFNAGAFYRNRRGEMYFGGVYGLNYFHPDSIRDNATVPSVVLTGVKKFDFPALLDLDPPEIRDLLLRFDESVFSLQFAALEYTNPARNQYAYWLEGFENSWIPAGSRREVRYTSLPPGEYTFRVKASNSDGVWNEEGLAVRIVIIPPFWRSWWFLSLCAIVLIGGIAGSVRYLELRRIRRTIARLEKEEAVQRERIRISRDMHDELGSTLTRISLLAGIAGAPGRKEPEIRDFLHKIEAASSEVVQHLDEVVWLVNPRNDTLESLAAYVAEYAEHFFAESPIRCRFDFPTTVPPLPVPAETRRNVFLAIKESLNNILKHSGAGVATLTLRLERNVLRLTVRDDGRGFTLPESAHLGNGIPNMRRRVDEVGGHYTLDSTPGGGTTLNLSFPLPSPGRVG